MSRKGISTSTSQSVVEVAAAAGFSAVEFRGSV